MTRRKRDQIYSAARASEAAGSQYAFEFITMNAREGLKEVPGRNPSYPMGRVQSGELLAAWMKTNRRTLLRGGDRIEIGVGPTKAAPKYMTYQEEGFDHVGGASVPGMFLGWRVMKLMKDVFWKEYNAS